MNSRNLPMSEPVGSPVAAESSSRSRNPFVLMRRVLVTFGGLFAFGLLGFLLAGTASAQTGPAHASRQPVPPAVGSLLSLTSAASPPVAKPVSSAVVTPLADAVVTPLVNAVVSPVANTVVKPVVSAVAPVTKSVSDVVAPVVKPVSDVVAPVVKPVTDVVASVVKPVTDAVAPVTDPLVAAVAPVLRPVVVSTPGASSPAVPVVTTPSTGRPTGQHVTGRQLTGQQVTGRQSLVDVSGDRTAVADPTRLPGSPGVPADPMSIGTAAGMSSAGSGGSAAGNGSAVMTQRDDVTAFGARHPLWTELTLVPLRWHAYGHSHPS